MWDTPDGNTKQITRNSTLPHQRQGPGTRRAAGWELAVAVLSARLRTAPTTRGPGSELPNAQCPAAPTSQPRLLPSPCWRLPAKPPPAVPLWHALSVTRASSPGGRLSHRAENRCLIIKSMHQPSTAPHTSILPVRGGQTAGPPGAPTHGISGKRDPLPGAVYNKGKRHQNGGQRHVCSVRRGLSAPDSGSFSQRPRSLVLAPGSPRACLGVCVCMCVCVRGGEAGCRQEVGTAWSGETQPAAHVR